MRGINLRISVPILIAIAIGCADKITNINNSYGPEDWQPPVIEWNYQPDAEVRGVIGIDVAIEDSSEVLWARLYLNGQPSIEIQSAPYRFEFDTDSLSDGVHVLEVRAQDAFGNLGISPILRINVMNSLAEGPRVLWVPDSFATIQAAINASMDYDTIRVRDGTYYETLNLFGKGIWMESMHGPTACTISGIASWNTILISSSALVATIRGFKLTGSQVVVRYDDGAQAILANNIVISDTAWSLLYAGSSGGNIVNNLFAGTESQYAAIQLAYFWGTFENNILMDAETWALYDIAMNVNPVFHVYNCFWNNGENYGRFTPGIGEFEADPLLDSLTYELLTGSPCIDAGDSTISDLDETRSDIGPGGGPLGYR